MPDRVTPSERNPAARSVPGRYVVLAMLGLGVVCTAGIWTYWKLELSTFMPLQKAIVAEFPGSSPRIDGGRRRSADPATLRIVMQVDFTPAEDDPRVAERIARVIELARAHIDFGPYEELHIYLVHRISEKPLEQYEYKRKMSDLAPPSGTASAP